MRRPAQTAVGWGTRHDERRHAGARGIVVRGMECGRTRHKTTRGGRREGPSMFGTCRAALASRPPRSPPLRGATRRSWPPESAHGSRTGGGATAGHGRGESATRRTDAGRPLPARWPRSGSGGEGGRALHKRVIKTNGGGAARGFCSGSPPSALSAQPAYAPPARPPSAAPGSGERARPAPARPPPRCFYTHNHHLPAPASHDFPINASPSTPITSSRLCLLLLNLHHRTQSHRHHPLAHDSHSRPFISPHHHGRFNRNCSDRG